MGFGRRLCSSALWCGEGAGVVLDAVMTLAWKNAGKVWNAVSSCIATVRLLLT